MLLNISFLRNGGRLDSTGGEVGQSVVLLALGRGRLPLRTAVEAGLGSSGTGGPAGAESGGQAQGLLVLCAQGAL